MDESRQVVVGAGPTGLMLACELKLMGVDVAVIERRAAGTTGESRAPGINARTMEVFAQRGLAERFRERGKALPAVLFSGIPMDPSKVDPGWPDALILPQHHTESILAERAAELGVPVLWGTHLVHFTQDDEGVDLSFEKGGMRARYLVGCDGGHSVVRRILGVPFTGDDPVSHWIVADVQLAAPPVQGAFGRNERIGTYQVSRVEPEWFRVSMMRLTPPLDRGAPVTLAEVRQTMIDGLGTDFGLTSTRWMSRFGDGFRQVERYRHGRVFLAGDAAHTHSPIGGQGLNLGIQDAVNLGWKLAAACNETAPPTLLDSYHDERHPIASEVLRLAKAQTALIKPGTQIDALRSVVKEMLAEPATTKSLSGFLSGLDLRYPLGGTHPLVGRRMPNLPLESGDVFSHMHAGTPVLFAFDDTKLAPPAHVTVVQTRMTGSWRVPVVGEVPPISAALVRPDGYVAWVAMAGSTDGLEPALQTLTL